MWFTSGKPPSGCEGRGHGLEVMILSCKDGAQSPAAPAELLLGRGSCGG